MAYINPLTTVRLSTLTALLSLALVTVHPVHASASPTHRKNAPRKVAAPARPVILKTDPPNYEFYMPNHTGHPDPENVALTVTGNHFKSGDMVFFGGKAMSTKFVSVTQLVASIPFDQIRSVPQSDPQNPSDMHGKAKLYVQNTKAKGLASAAYFFEIVAIPMGG